MGVHRLMLEVSKPCRNLGHALVFMKFPQFAGKNGAQSLSDVETYGYHAGIRHADGRYQTLHQETGSRSQGFQGGNGAPQTWANGGTLLGPGFSYINIILQSTANGHLKNAFVF